jgi:phospholipase A2-like protein
MRQNLLVVSSVVLAGQLVFVAPASGQTEHCVESEPVDCSFPWQGQLATLGTSAYYNEKFGKACLRHDYCYRHGQKTYGYSKDYCDDSFYKATKDTCEGVSVGTFLSLGTSKGACYTAAEAYYQAVRKFGASSYKTGSASTYCRFDSKYENAHLHKVNADGTIGERLNEYIWSDGWTTVESYNVGTAAYVFLMKTHNGKVHIHKPSATTGLLGGPIASYDWDLNNNILLSMVSSSWTNAQAYQVGGKPYLFVLKPANGHARVYAIKADGTVGDRMATYDLTDGWTDVKVFTAGTAPYIFTLKTSTGVAHINRIMANGTVGPSVQKYDWSDGWTNVEFYRIRGKTYAFFLKSGNGKVHLYEVAPNGTLGTRIAGYDWSDDWTTAKFYEVGGKTYLFTLKAKNGTAHVSQMTDDGKIGRRVKEYDWRDGWTGATFYKVGDQPHVLFVRAWAGGKPPAH